VLVTTGETNINHGCGHLRRAISVSLKASLIKHYFVSNLDLRDFLGHSERHIEGNESYDGLGFPAAIPMEASYDIQGDR
jgi:hypothetical protein